MTRLAYRDSSNTSLQNVIRPAEGGVWPCHEETRSV